MTSNSSAPWSPTYGTTDYTSVTPTDTLMSPSRYSYSDAPTQSTDSEDASPRRAMRRITVSPSPSSEDSNGAPYHYEEENSFDDADEVAATLNTLEDDINETEDLWTRTASSTATPSSFSGTYSGSYTPTSSSLAPLPPAGTFPRAGHIQDPHIRLSIISERTEPSRPTSSGAYSTTQYARPNAPTPDAHRRSGVSSHTRSSTDPNADRELPPPGRAIELIARFETNSPGGGHLRTASAPGGPRSPSPYMSASQSTPHLPSTAGYNYTSSYGYGSTYGYGSRSSSPSKSSSSISSSASEERISNTLSTLATQRAVTSTSGDTRFLTTDTGSQTPTGSRTGTGYLSPSAYTNTFTNTGSQTPTRTGASYLSPSAYTGTFTNTGYTATYNESDTFTGTGTTPTGSSLRRPQNISPRSPLTSVRNIVAAWKERTPVSGARAGGRASSVTSTTPPGEEEGGLLGIRRRAQRVGQRIGQAIMGGPEESVTDATPRSARSIGLPPGLDIADLTPYTQTNEQPQHIGLLWYLNVHASPPYRWQRCQALLYPHMLLLSWLAAGGGRGIVAVDLLNCNSVQSAATPTHPSARDDVGTIAAMRQSNEPDGQPLMDVLVPFHMLYADGVERLAAESVHERSKWVHRICELLPATPAPSRTQSPTGSMRTILSIDTTSSSSSVGSRSTVFVPPLSSIPDISDDFDTRSTFSRTTSFISTHHTGTVDDTAILGQGYVYRGDPRVIAPSRGGSLRRTSSLTDMDQEFASALDRARGARPGLGFASRVILGGSPVTVSSGSSLGKDVFVTPPPSARGSSTPHGSSTDLSDEAFFSAGSGTSDTRTTSLYTLTSTGRDRTTTGFTSTGFTTTNTTTGLTSGDSDTNVVSSTLSYRRTDSASYLGDSHDSDSYFSSGSSRTPLTRSSALSRRTGRSNSRSNSSGFPYSSDEASDKENSSNTMSGSSYTQSGTRSSDDTGYDVCHSSDLSALTLNSYSTYSYSTASSSEFSEVPPSSAPSSDVFASASEGSGSYVTAASPASTAFESLPSIPSESEYGTADEAASTEYATASEPSEYITAEVCPSEPGTEYLTAIEPREIPSELSTPKASSSLHLESDVEIAIEPDIAEEEQIEKELVLSDESPEEAETESILPSPSEVPTIITTESEGDDLLDPASVPLPPSLPPSTSSLSSITLDEVTPSFSPSSEPTTVLTPSSISFSATELTESSLPGPSPIGTEPASTPLLPLSSVSSISESSLTPTPSSLTPSSPLDIARSVPATPVTISPSLWASETDDSYESSVLAASASVVTMANEGPDFSYDTSILRPTGSAISSPDRLTTIPETVLETPSRFTSLPPVTPVRKSPPLPPIPITEPAEPVEPVEAAESPESDISSSTPPTASDLTLSSTTESPSLITESSLSRSSEQESSYVSSSTVSSLLPSEEVLPVPAPEDIPDDVSTIPSLLSTPRAAIARPLSPSSISLVSTSPSLLMSPQLPTPEDVTMSVSISTPRGDTPSIHSLDSQRTPTMSVASIRTDRSISNDIRRLADDLRRMDDVRGEENRELVDHIQALRHELHDLSEYLRRTPSPILRADKRDQKVGGSSLLSVDRATPKGPTELSVPTPTGTNLSRANSIASSMISYLSSHHSDDFSLYGGSPVVEERELEPAMEEGWRIPSPQSSTTSSSSLSSSSPYSSSSTSLPTPHSIASTPPVPSLVSHSTSTSTTSTSSTSTVRARPAFPNLAPALDGIRDKLNALWDGQLSTNHILDELRAHRPGMPEPAGPDIEMHNRLHRIEGLVQSLLDRPIQQAPAPLFPQPEIHRDQPRQPTDDSSEAPSSDSSSDYINGLINALNDLRTNPPEPHIQMPIPQTAGPSLAQQLEEILSSTAPVPPSVVQGPPPLVPFSYQPIGTRPRSASPLSLRDMLRRPGTEPPLPHIRDIPPPSRTGRRVRAHPRRRYSLYSQARSEEPVIPVAPPPGLAPSQQLRDEGRGVPSERVPRRGPTPEPVFPGRDTTASAPPPGWYRPSPPSVVPPPPVLDQPAQQRATTQQRTYLPMPAGPTIVQLPPLFENLMEILRENRLAQLATVDQQRELMRYMRGLNEWLERDVHDRQAELRGVAARVDDLTSYIRRLGAQPRRDRPDGSSSESDRAYPPQMQMQMPIPQSGPGPAPPMPVPQTGMPQPMFTPYPPGFVPVGGVIPPVVPDHSPPYDNGRPVIPDMHAPIVINQPPVIPGGYHQPMGMPPPGMMSVHDEQPVRPYIPPEPSASGSPPYQVRPPGGYGPTIVRVPASEPSSSGGSSTHRSSSRRPSRHPSRRSERSERSRRPSERSRSRSSDRRGRGRGRSRSGSRSRSRSPRSRRSRSSSSNGSRTPIIIPGQIPQVQVVPGPPVVSVQPGPQYVAGPATTPRPGSPRHPDAPQHPTPSPQPMVINIPGQQPTMVPGMMPGMMPGPGGMMPSQIGMMPPQVGMPGVQHPTIVDVRPSRSPSRSSRSSRSRSRSPRSRSSRSRRSRRSPRSRSRSRSSPRTQRDRPSSRSPSRRSRRSPRRSRSRSHSPASIHVHTQPPQSYVPTVPGMMPSGMQGGPMMPGMPGMIPTGPGGVVVLPQRSGSSRSRRSRSHRSRRSRSRSRSRSRTPPPQIIQVPGGPQSYPTQPYYPSAPGSQIPPTQVVLPPQGYPGSQYPPGQYPPGQFPPGGQPTMMVPQQPTVVAIPGSRSRSSSRSRRSRSRSRSRSPRRDQPAVVLQTQPPTTAPMQPAPTPLIVTQSPSHRSRSRSRSRSPRSYPPTYAPDPSRYTPSRPQTAMGPSERPYTDRPRRHGSRSYSPHGGSPSRRRRSRSDSPHRRRDSRGRYDDRYPGDRYGGRERYGRGYRDDRDRPGRDDPYRDDRDRPDRDYPYRERDDRDRPHSPRRRSPSHRSPSRHHYPRSRSHSPYYSRSERRRPRSRSRSYSPSGRRRPGRRSPSLRLEPSRYGTPAPAHTAGPSVQPTLPPSSDVYAPRHPQQAHVIAPSAEYSDQPSSPHFVTVPSRPTQPSATPRPLTALSVAEHEEPGLYRTPSRVGRTPTGRSGVSGGYSPAPSEYADHRPPEVVPVPEDMLRRPPPPSHTSPVSMRNVPSPSVHTVPAEDYPASPSRSAAYPPSHAPSRVPTQRIPTQRLPSESTVAPVPHPLRPVTPFPGDLEAAEMARERLERLDDMEQQLQHIAGDAHEAEELREREFRDHEEDRQRIFLDNEARRDHEVRERHDEIWSDLENRIAMLAPPPPRPTASPPASPPPPSIRPSIPPSIMEQEPTIPGEPMTDTASVMESLRASQEAASLHAQSIMQTIQSERDEFARERDAAAAERERLMADLQADRERMLEERDARIQTLEDELAAVKSELENEKQQRVTEEAENRERERQQNIERDEMIRNQLGDITNLLQDQQAGLAQKRDLMDERWQDKLDRRQDKDYKWIELRDMVNKIHDDLEADRREENERRFAAEQKPGIDQVMAELQRQNGELRELLHNMSNDIRTECGQQHEETLNAVRASAQEQVSFNVQGYLDDFSKLLASEVKMLLGEVGKLREEKRSLKHEVGFLLCVQSKYGPGGEYEPEWKPPAPPGPPADAPPPEPPMPPEMPPAAKPGWRFTHRARPRRKKEQAPAPPPPGPSAMQMPPGMDPRMDPRRQVQSWATWQPDPHLVPTPPSVEPTLIVPERGSPGLFGPRSPRSSYS